MKRRFMIDSDGSNLFGYTMTDDVEFCVNEAARECHPDVTTYLLCAGAGTWYYPTKVGDVRNFELLKKAHATGIDPFGMTLKAIKETGRETCVTVRMNDVHYPNAKDGWNAPRIRREKPDCVVAPDAVKSGNAGWWDYCMDYSREDVREYMLAIVAEIAGLYDIDAIQLDWMRFPRHLSGSPEEVWNKRDCLTEFVERAREAVKEIRPGILMGVRVPSSVEGWRFTGMDAGEWTKRGLVDWVVAAPFLTTDQYMPIDEMRAAMGNAGAPLYAGFEFSLCGRMQNPESLRATATSLYDCGADGLYIFNFPCWTERITARPFHWLDGLNAPDTSARKPLLFSATYKRNRKEGVDIPPQLPAEIPAGDSREFSLYMPAAALPAWRCQVLVYSRGDVGLALNGAPARENPKLRRAEIFVEHTPQARKNYTPMPRPNAEDCRLFYADPAALRPGINKVELINSEDASLTIERIDAGLW